jgi:hypothetical protein
MSRVREWLKQPRSWVELGASFGTLAGVALGTTTALGGSIYLAANGFWIALILMTRMWGLVPLTAATTVVTLWTLWRL